MAAAIAADGPLIVVPGPGAGAGAPAAAPRFSDAQVAYVQGWIRDQAPECPADVAGTVAQAVLEDLKANHPGQLDLLLTADFPARDFDAALLQQVGARLTAPAQAALREEIARRRVATLLARQGGVAPAGAAGEAGRQLAQLKEASPFYYTRLVEGRMDDDEVLTQLRKTGPAAPSVTAPAQPKVMTAADIVSEFARRNQTGSALQSLRACTIDARLKTATGEEQRLLLFKLRPNRFRLAVLVDGVTRYILGFDGAHYWQQVPGQAVQLLKPEAMGERRYLGEFADALFAEEGNGYGFERGEDGVAGDQKFYRVAVRRADGSKYVAHVDMQTFRETGRENADGSVTRYSDFRAVAGVTVGFHEEVTDSQGHKGVLEVTRMTPNPGLIQTFFEPQPPSDPGYFDLERVLSQAPVAPSGKGKG